MTPDSRFIVSCSKDKSIKIFDLEKLEEVYHFKNIHEGSEWFIKNLSFTGAIRSVTVTPDNQSIISGSIDRVIKILNIETKQEVFEFKEAHQSKDFYDLEAKALHRMDKISESDTRWSVYRFMF